MAEAPPPTSIAARIAALNINQVGRAPGVSPPPSYEHAVAAKKARPPPPLPPKRPAVEHRSVTTNNPPLQSNGPASVRSIGNQPAGLQKRAVLPPPQVNGSAKESGSGDGEVKGPALPPRPSQKESLEQAPALPPRRPSEQSTNRRDSLESLSSVRSGKSSISTKSTRTSFSANSGSDGQLHKVKAPPYDPASLPPLPERRVSDQREQTRAALRSNYSSPSVVANGSAKRAIELPPMRPPVPSRSSSVTQEATKVDGTLGNTTEPAEARPPLPLRPSAVSQEPARVTPPPRRSALSFALNKSTETPPPLPVNERPQATEDETPPPVPLSSRPNIAQIQASKPGRDSGVSQTVHIESPRQFEALLSSSRIVIADFYADWCGPCKNIAPVFEQLSAQHSRPNHVTFAKLNTDTQKQLFRTYEVKAMPTFIIFEDGREATRIRGATAEGWTKAVKQYAPETVGVTPAQPPPVPMSRPSPELSSSPSGVCLKCRDFSGPDTHAARFPRQSIPSTDISWLAHNLTSSFPSPTDKARALFTWLHHNIEYDTTAFFAGKIQPCTPASTIASGLAVCEGYAGLFAALATTAGLEAIVISGHGKGYSYAALKAGEPVPPFNSNHAWNAVKIDGGEWKLIDTCWGAGAIDGLDKPYIKRFAPEFFTMDNNEFGLRHFPTDNRYFYRVDGRAGLSWEKYMLDGAGAEEKLTVYSGCVEHGIAEQSFLPRQKRIKVHDPTQPPVVRFQYEKVCRHWDSERMAKGKPYFMVLHVRGRDGRKDDYLPFQTNGFVSWVDVPRVELGAPGQTVSLYYIKTMGEREGRGLTLREFRDLWGKVGWSFGGVAAWELV